MKSIILIAFALVAVTVAAPSKPAVKPPQIITSEFVLQPEGSYVFRFETEDGVIREESGVVKEILDENNKLHKIVVVHGSYTSLNADGKPQTITYFADETGYHAEGDTIPKIETRT